MTTLATLRVEEWKLHDDDAEFRQSVLADIERGGYDAICALADLINNVCEAGERVVLARAEANATIASGHVTLSAVKWTHPDCGPGLNAVLTIERYNMAGYELAAIVAHWLRLV